MHHELKIDRKYYRPIVNGSKKFEVRENDRDFKPLDTFELVETFHGLHTGRSYGPKTISYVLEGGQFGIDDNYCVFCWEG
jgi:hypothetical protein